MFLQTLEIDPQASRLILGGKMDIRGSETLALPLATLSDSKRALIIDMAAVTFLASVGLRHLAAAARSIARRDGRLVLLKPTEAILDVLKTSGLTDVLPVVNSDEEALAAIAA